jgi:RluA family pseudouridine synthase
MKWLAERDEKLVPFLQARLGSYSGKQLRKALEANLCRVNARVERFGSASLKRGDVVEIAPSWKSLFSEKITSFKTIFEDEFFKIVDKPAGWVCETAETLKSFGPGHQLVHRLDKDTTGLLILAKSKIAEEKMVSLFEKREVAKEYLALVDGLVQKKEGTIANRLAKKGSFQGQTIWGAADKGLTAITDWSLLATGKETSLILCRPKTGRTHQIRVHMAEMHHPILIDRQYAKTFRSKLFVQRPLLHAHRLSFIHPFTEEKIEVESPLPGDFKEILALEMKSSNDGNNITI